MSIIAGLLGIAYLDLQNKPGRGSVGGAAGVQHWGHSPIGSGFARKGASRR